MKVSAGENSFQPCTHEIIIVAGAVYHHRSFISGQRSFGSPLPNRNLTATLAPVSPTHPSRRYFPMNRPIRFPLFSTDPRFRIKRRHRAETAEFSLCQDGNGPLATPISTLINDVELDDFFRATEGRTHGCYARFTNSRPCKEDVIKFRFRRQTTRGARPRHRVRSILFNRRRYLIFLASEFFPVSFFSQTHDERK